MRALDITALVLVIIGGLNWLLVGLFTWDLVEAIFGGVPIVQRIIYILVGIAAIWVAVRVPTYLRAVPAERHTTGPAETEPRREQP